MDDCRFQRAVDKRDSGHPSEAYEDFHAMLQGASTSEEKASLLLNMGTCKTWLGDFEDARNLIQQARALFPLGERLPQLYADFVEASTLASTRQFAEAAFRFRRLLNEYSDLLSTPDEHGLHIDARQRLAFALVASRQFENAVPILENLLKQGAGERQRIQLYLGIAYSFLPNKNAEARDRLLAASHGPDLDLTTEAVCRVGILEFQTGRFAAAAEFLKRTVSEGLDGSEWKKIAQDYIGRIQESSGSKVM